MRSFFATFTFYLLTCAFGAIGPTANLYIENDDISPDGFTRSYVQVSQLIVVNFFEDVHIVLSWQAHPPEEALFRVLS